MNKREWFPKASKFSSQLLAAATRPLRLLGLALAMLGLLASTMTLHAAGNNNTPTIVGTWIIEVSFNGAACNPGDTVLFQCVYGLLTFNADDTMSEVDTFASGAKQSWGTGVWEQTSSTTFKTTFEQLQFSGSRRPSHYDVVLGPVKVSNDGQTSTASGGFASYDFYNNAITLAGYSGSYTTTGTLMNLLTSQAPEPLP